MQTKNIHMHIFQCPFKAQEIYEWSLINVRSAIVVTVQVGSFQHDKPNIYGLLVPRRCWELEIKKRKSNLMPCFNWNTYNIVLFHFGQELGNKITKTRWYERAKTYDSLIRLLKKSTVIFFLPSKTDNFQVTHSLKAFYSIGRNNCHQVNGSAMWLRSLYKHEGHSRPKKPWGNHCILALRPFK